MKTLVLLIVSVALGGCTYRKFEHPTHGTYTSFGLGTSQSIGAIEVKTGSDTGVKLEGYTSESAQVAAAAVAAAVKAVGK